MFTAQELSGAIMAISLRDGYTQLSAAIKCLEDQPGLATQECFIILNEFESDVFPVADCAETYKTTLKPFFMSFAKQHQVYLYKPDCESIEKVEREYMVDMIMDNAKF